MNDCCLGFDVSRRLFSTVRRFARHFYDVTRRFSSTLTQVRSYILYSGRVALTSCDHGRKGRESLAGVEDLFFLTSPLYVDEREEKKSYGPDTGYRSPILVSLLQDVRIETSSIGWISFERNDRV